MSATAGEFSGVFRAGEWGRVLGLWHDLGKFSPAFQNYLLSAAAPDSHEAEWSARVDHSSAGAQHAVSRSAILGHLLAYPIAGHHSGLLDGIATGACLEARLNKTLEDWRAAPESLLDESLPEPPEFIRDAIGRRDGFSVAFFVRMIFSSLVDADFLDTEGFMDTGKAQSRPTWPNEVLLRMGAALDRYLADLRSDATEVLRQRGWVLDACLEAASRPPGLYSLTVPTGGGKTLSSLSFALNHAIHHGLRRVIYVCPFTSIIEQNAAAFREVMSPLVRLGMIDPVVEHHSNLEAERETMTTRLAAENWDAPLIVTTGVQFYESLFANRTSRCRKLHNIAGSVVILDEAQAIPVDYLEPCLRALEELRKNYGCTILLCTATQPALGRRESFPIGIELGPDREIIPDPPKLFAALKRVEVERAGLIPDDDLVSRLLEEEQVLCIVNTRAHASRLAMLLEDQEQHFHLSGLMCPQHRTERLDQIRERLQSGEPCRVVSTRLIESGVDIDFPVVYRSMAGLDSIAQAAGRCNRNGRLPVGRTVVFEPEDRSAERFLADTAGSGRQVLPLYDDPLSVEAVEHYFRLYYWEQADRWDRKKILEEFHLVQDRSLPFQFAFAKVGQEFRLIENAGRSIIVPWGEDGKALCEEVRSAWNGRVPVSIRRKLQRYSVSISERLWRENRGRAFELVHELYPVLVNLDFHYSDFTGLVLEYDSSDLLIA